MPAGQALRRSEDSTADIGCDGALLAVVALAACLAPASRAAVVAPAVNEMRARVPEFDAQLHDRAPHGDPGGQRCELDPGDR